MKKISIITLSLLLGISVANSQQVKNKQIGRNKVASYYEAVSKLDPNDVSYHSPIRFDMHNSTADERAQANADYLDIQTQKNPNYAADRNAYEQQIQNYLAANRSIIDNNESNQSVITLPVVVHCVYGSAGQNISLNQVLSQLQVMNEDFSRTNADANTHWSQAANTTVQFCLAQQTPSGQATTGLETRQFGTSSTSWTQNDNVKHYSSGGLDIWDPTRYLNIWVCNLSGSLLGYGEFPTSSTSPTFGVVIDYTCFGSNFTSYGTFAGIAAPYDRGRTVTHEFSHCFNLYHIWGDDFGACSGSDLCADTPNQADATSGCYTFPHTDACSTTNPGIMFENYMDYSDDNCLNLFTANQKSRILAMLNIAPYNALQTSNGCSSPSALTNDAGISVITTPTGSLCGLTFTPVVTLKNFGTNTLTTVTIKYKIDNNTLQTYTWNGSLSTNATTSVTLSSMTTTAATHTFTCYTLNPNSVADGNATNDQLTSTFTASAGGQSLPFFEGFEGSTFVPAGWTLNNPDGSTTWDRTTTCSKTGVACARMDNWGYQTGVGQRDEITAPAVNVSTVSNPVLTFQVAYTYWTVPYQYSDTLQVLVSTNCGFTWTSVYLKYGATLATAPPLTSTVTAFVPNASQWRLETVSLLPYQSATSLLVKFRNGSSYEDDLYLDDINIMNSTGVAALNLSNNVNLYPNPSSGIFNLNISLPSQQKISVNVMNMLGQTISANDEGISSGGNYQLNLSDQPDGVYFVEVIAGEEKIIERLVINR